jgi:hypothetical protein
MKLLHREDQLPLSTKKVWQLKKYSRTSDEIELEQQQYATLEFSPQKSTRRPRQKPGEQKEFVFVDLSPKKKAGGQQRLQASLQLEDVTKDQDPIQHQIIHNTEKRKRQGLSRLFRLSSEKAQLQESPSDLDTPPLASSSSPILPQVIEVNSTPAPQLRRTLTPLVMTVSSDGRAVLQHSSASSSTTDLFSLSQRSPSPKREAESPVDYSSDDDDATRAFERVLRRKRANTAGSISSISRTQLTRNQSISSISSVYNRARASPSRPTHHILRQSTPVESRPSDDFLGSFFDDTSKEPERRGFHVRQQKSISTLGPPLGMDHYDDPDITLSKPMDDMTEFFDFGAFSETYAEQSLEIEGL